MKQAITFEDRAEKTFVIRSPGRDASAPAGRRCAVAPPSRARPPSRAPHPSRARRAQRPAPPPEAAAPAESGGGGNCTLNFNSIPVSNVVLDGKPLGGTPKLGDSASAGSHTVIFVTPRKARR